jgi:Rad3-related DNA helicase
MTWSLFEIDKKNFDENGKNIEKHRKLHPLTFCNGKSQEDVVKEVLEAVKKGDKIIFIHGVCGTGKSAIALNIARKLGKTSIVVPIKNLQEQYKRDYEKDKYLLKDNGEKLKISVMTGRKNHVCKFLEDNAGAIPKIKQEINSKLHDIFEGKREEAKQLRKEDLSANNSNLPCKIEIREKNWKKIKQYLKQNNKVNIQDFDDIKDVKRASVAAACPYWSPVMPDQYELKSFSDSKKKTYMGLNNTRFNFYSGKPGCSFYEQFNYYVDSDVIVFNSLKYKLETALNRKPLTEVEIIDECDEFLDSFSNSRNINLDRLQNSLVQASWLNDMVASLAQEMNELIQSFKRDERIKDAAATGEIVPLRETSIYDLFKILLKNQELILQIDEESYVFDVEESARMFEDFLDDSYLTISKRDEQWIVSVVTTNLAKRFKDLADKNKVLVLMSGTLHSEEVLRDIFGLENFKKVEAEIKNQGRINVVKTGLEMDCRYSNFSSGKHTRENYLKALSKCLKVAEKPVLVHVNGFVDLPSEQELEEYDIDNLISKEKLRELQDKDRAGKIVNRFKKGQIDVLFTTKCGRGVDFPGDQCKSIVFTKYPNPNVQDAFWKILNKTKPQYYWAFYKDKAKRELWQKVYRGLRFKEDFVNVLSPDSRVLDAFEEG